MVKIGAYYNLQRHGVARGYEKGKAPKTLGSGFQLGGTDSVLWQSTYRNNQPHGLEIRVRPG